MAADFHERFQGEAGAVLDAILAHDRDGIVMLTTTGDIEFVSRGGLGQLVADTGQAAIGSAWRLVWPEADRMAIDRAIAAAADGQSSRFESTNFVDGSRRWWDVIVCPVRNPAGEIAHLVAIATDVTARRAAARDDRLRREEAEREAGFAGDVARELRHRLKNQLAVIGAVAKLLARHTETARDLAFKLEGKLISLARAQDLLTVHRDQSVPANEAVAQVIEASGAGEQICVAPIPPAGLSDESIQTLALVLGELQTNALKHGALKDDGGTVNLSGTAEDQVLTLCWRENCRGKVTPAEAGNGGFQLIRRLGATGSRRPSIEWHEHGICVRIHIRAET